MLKYISGYYTKAVSEGDTFLLEYLLKLKSSVTGMVLAHQIVTLGFEVGIQIMGVTLHFNVRNNSASFF